MTQSYFDLDKPFVVVKYGRVLAFVTCDTRVGDELDAFDFSCVVTTNVFFALSYAPALPTITVGFAVFYTIDGLEGDISVGVVSSSMLRSGR